MLRVPSHEHYGCRRTHLHVGIASEQKLRFLHSSSCLIYLLFIEWGVLSDICVCMDIKCSDRPFYGHSPISGVRNALNEHHDVTEN
jgi:hypothetical protein